MSECILILSLSLFAFPEPRIHFTCAPTSAKFSEDPRTLQLFHAPRSPPAQTHRTQCSFLIHRSFFRNSNNSSVCIGILTSNGKYKPTKHEPEREGPIAPLIGVPSTRSESHFQFITASMRKSSAKTRTLSSPRYFVLTLNTRVVCWTLLSRPAQLGQREKDVILTTSPFGHSTVRELVTFLSSYLSLDQIVFTSHSCAA